MISYRDFYIYEKDNRFTVGDSDNCEFDSCTLENFYCGTDETVMVDWNMKHGNSLVFYEFRQDGKEVSYEDYIRHFVNYDSDTSFIVPTVYFTSIEKVKEFIDWIIEGDSNGYGLTEEIQNAKSNFISI